MLMQSIGSLSRAAICLMFIACFPHVSIANEPCPCAEGYTCCPGTERCLADAALCAEALRESASFSVHIDAPTSIRDVYATDPTVLRFTVRGCDTFSATVELRGLNRIVNEMGPWHSAPLPVTHVDGETYESRFALRDVASYDGCNAYDEEYPLEGELRLHVVCDSASEELVTESLPVYYVGSVRSMSMPSVERVWPLATPHHFMATMHQRSSYWLGVWHQDASLGQPLAEHFIGAKARGRPHLFAQAGALGFLADGVSEPPMTPAPDGTPIAGASVVELDLREPMTAVAAAALIVRRFDVPGSPVQMLPQADGSVNVLAEAWTASGQPWGLIVSRIDPSAAVDRAQVIASYPAEVLVSSNADTSSGVFVSKEAVAGGLAPLHVRALDGASSAPTPWENPFGAAIERVEFAPDGKQWLVMADGAYLGHPDSGWTKLTLPDPQYFQPVWNRDAVILWLWQDVYVYPRRGGGGTWRTHHVLNSNVAPTALANGGFLIGDATGVRFLDANGLVARHVDIPGACRSSFGALTADLGDGWVLYAPYDPVVGGKSSRTRRRSQVRSQPTASGEVAAHVQESRFFRLGWVCLRPPQLALPEGRGRDESGKCIVYRHDPVAPCLLTHCFPHDTVPAAAGQELVSD